MKLGWRVRVNVKVAAVAGVVFLLLFLVLRYGVSDSRLSGAELTRAAIRAAIAGGEAVRGSSMGTVRSKGKTREGADELVTSADAASHCRMTSVLLGAFPDLRLVSEEKVDCAPSTLPDPEPPSDFDLDALPDEWFDPDDVLVWIDPLDATQEFTEKLEEYVTTMVCVTVAGVPLVGVIHKPFRGETAWARSSKASSFKDKSVERPRFDGSARVIVSRSHTGDADTFVHKAFGSEASITHAGGAGYKVLEVVAGHVDVYVHTTLVKKWDVCAGNAILDALGGRMSTLKNETIDYSDGSRPAVENGLLAALRGHEEHLTKVEKAAAGR